LLKTLNDIDTIEDLKALDKFPSQKSEDWF
jgi:hypothetical protein